MDDWESVTKIGSKTRGAGGGPRETVIRGKSALNAAQRSGGIIATEKKYATGNSSTVKAAGQEGQRMTKVDRSDEIVKPVYVDKEVAKLIGQTRNAMVPKMSQVDLGNRILKSPKIIADFESGRALNDTSVLLKIEKVLKVKLTGSNIGAPLYQPKKSADAKAGSSKK